MAESFENTRKRLLNPRLSTVVSNCRVLPIVRVKLFEKCEMDPINSTVLSAAVSLPQMLVKEEEEE